MIGEHPNRDSECLGVNFSESSLVAPLVLLGQPQESSPTPRGLRSEKILASVWETLLDERSGRPLEVPQEVSLVPLSDSSLGAA